MSGFHQGPPTGGHGQWIGRTLGDFRLVERIGEGGMGLVFKAQNIRLEKMVRAIKVVRGELAADPSFRERFMREAEYMELLRHDNILRVDNIGEQDGMLFMVMELLAGETLDQRVVLEPGRLPLPQVIAWLLQALAGLGHAHKQQIIHRDLKPSNLFLTRDGVIKILDFGIARHGGSSSKLTVTSQGIPGSPAYYAPEFSEGAPASPQSDMYALGISMFELLAGRVPFEGGGSSDTQRLMSLLVQHSTKPLPDIRQVRPDVPEEVASVLRRAAAKRPAERYPDARSFAVDLNAAFKASSGGAPSADAYRAAPAPAPAAATRFAMPGKETLMMAAQAPEPEGAPAPGYGAHAAAPAATRFVMPGMPGAGATPGHGSGVAHGGGGPARGPGSVDAGTRFVMPGTSSPVAPAAGPGAAASAGAARADRGSPWVTRLVIAGGAIVTIALVAVMASSKDEAPARAAHPAGATSEATAHAGGDLDAGPPPGPAHPVAAPPGMVAIPGGTLQQGRRAYDRPGALDVPAHPVEVKGFYLGKVEVTVEMYAAFTRAGGVAPPWGNVKDISQIAALPVVNVSAADAEAYCRWSAPPSGRLPTEAEWEWAARGAQARLYPWGDEFRADCVNGLRGEAGAPRPASDFDCGATPTGLLAMSGNVWEWTSSAPTVYPGSTVKVPDDPSFRVVRGGSFFNTDESDFTTTVRQFVPAPSRYIGFRCAAPMP